MSILTDEKFGRSLHSSESKFYKKYNIENLQYIAILQNYFEIYN